MTAKCDIQEAITYAEALLDEHPGNPEIQHILWILDDFRAIPDLLGIDYTTEIESTIIEKG
jgi:hypothetical protein